MPDIETSTKGVRKLLQNLNPCKAAGPDNIPCCLLKLVAQEIAPALTLLFRKSINTGEVSTARKHAFIQPVFKKQDHSSPSDYWPISGSPSDYWPISGSPSDYWPISGSPSNYWPISGSPSDYWPISGSPSNYWPISGSPSNYWPIPGSPSNYWPISGSPSNYWPISGSPSNYWPISGSPSNYWPISLTLVCGKLLEHIVHAAITSHFDHNILVDAQHGFCKIRACETQLILTVDYLVVELDKGGQTDTVLLNFAKAFNKMPHQQLFNLRFHGVHGQTHHLIENFLYQRTQQVTAGQVSSIGQVTSGVLRISLHQWPVQEH